MPKTCYRTHAVKIIWLTRFLTEAAFWGQAERKDGSERPERWRQQQQGTAEDGSDGAKDEEHSALETEAEQECEGTDFDSLKAERCIYSQSNKRYPAFESKLKTEEKDKQQIQLNHLNPHVLTKRQPFFASGGRPW